VGRVQVHGFIKLGELNMKTINYTILSLLITLLVSGVALANELVIYPANGQSPEQMDKEKYECYSWAKQESGFDPMQQPKATEPPPPQEAPKGGVGRGAARGAAVGAVGGKVANDDAGEGAKTGAAVGAVTGGMRRNAQKREQQQKEQQWAEQQATNYAKNRDGYNRAYSACLEGKGYTVK
jgi:hypothetical protein